MHHLILYQDTNKKLRKDSKYVFTPESEALEAFLKERGDTVERRGINGNLWDKDEVKADLVEALVMNIGVHSKIDALHCLCHGWPKGFQFGFKNQSGAKLLAQWLCVTSPKYVNLYACLTGKGLENFAKWVAEYCNTYMNDEKPRLMCHSSKGHSTKNPNVKVYYSDNDNELQSYSIYTKTDKLYWIWWYLLQTTTLRFEFPFLANAEIDAIVLEASERVGIWSEMKKLRKKVLKF